TRISVLPPGHQPVYIQSPPLGQTLKIKKGAEWGVYPAPGCGDTYGPLVDTNLALFPLGVNKYMAELRTGFSLQEGSHIRRGTFIGRRRLETSAKAKEHFGCCGLVRQLISSWPSASA